MLRTRSERVPKRVRNAFQNAFATRSKTRSEHLRERVRNTFLNAFGTPSRTRSWMRSETRVISLWSFESLRKIPNTLNDNTVNPNSSSSHYPTNSNAQEKEIYLVLNKHGKITSWKSNSKFNVVVACSYLLNYSKFYSYHAIFMQSVLFIG